MGIDIPVIADDQVPPGTMALVSAGRDENGEVKASGAVAVNVGPGQSGAQAPRVRDLATFEYRADGPPMHAPAVNGHKLTSVMSFTVAVDVDSFPVVMLKLMPADMLKLMFDGVIVSVDDETRQALVSLGWTPPEDAP